jgi:uncharacterized protein YggU (UPF0235/DUF167 family)
VEGAANKALLKLLAKALGVPLTALTLMKGSSGRRKEVIVSGIPLEKARQVLLQGNR